jgi:hypothetical protein
MIYTVAMKEPAVAVADTDNMMTHTLEQRRQFYNITISLY